jgi:hypothetical protein
MRRPMLVLMALLAVTSFGLLETSAMALAAAPKLHITLGTQWTEYVVIGQCQVLTFAEKGTGPNRFTSDKFGDGGTYSGGGRKVSATVTTGGDVGLTFKGRWVKSVKWYELTFGGNATGNVGLLVEGVDPLNQGGC